MAVGCWAGDACAVLVLVYTFLGLDDYLVRIIEYGIEVFGDILEPYNLFLSLVEGEANLAATHLRGCHADALGFLVFAGTALCAAFEPVAGAEVVCSVSAQTAHDGATVLRRAAVFHAYTAHTDAVVDARERSVVEVSADAASVAVGSGEGDGTIVGTIGDAAVLVGVANNATEAVVICAG